MEYEKLLWAYDKIGRVTSMRHLLGGVSLGDGVTFAFQYNPASQITSRTLNNDAYANTAHYDVDRDYQVNGLNQYVQGGPAAFTYDDNGNLTSDGSVNFTYDTENRLTGASGGKTANLVYDPMGRLYETNTGSNQSKTIFLYDGNALVAGAKGVGFANNMIT